MPRVYAPVTADDVAALLSSAQCAPRTTFSVTPHLRQVLPQEDEEGLEHVATQFAAAAAAGDPVAVGVFDVAASAWSAADEDSAAIPGSTRMTGPLRHRELVCFLVADPGERVTPEADLELSWYDASELPAVRDLLGQPQGD